MEITQGLNRELKVVQGFHDKKVFKDIFMRAFKHFREKMNSKIHDKVTEFNERDKYVELFREIIAVDKFGGGGEQQVPLLPDTFNYQLLPEAVRIRAVTDNRDFFFMDNDYNIEIKVV